MYFRPLKKVWGQKVKVMKIEKNTIHWFIFVASFRWNGHVDSHFWCTPFPRATTSNHHVSSL